MATLVGDISHRVGDSATQTDTSGEAAVTYLVRLDSSTESLASIVAATGVTFGTSTNPADDNQTTFEASIAPYENEPLMRVVRFSFSSSQTQDEEDERNPLDRRIKIDWSSVTYQRFVKTDRNGDPILNSANDPFIDLPGVDDTRWAINIEQNVSTVPVWVLTYANKLNSSSVTIDGVTFPAETLKVQSLTISDVQFENKTSFRTIRLQIQYRENGWPLEVTDAGLHEIIAVTGGFWHRPIKIPFLDENGSVLDYDNPRLRAVTRPWPLDSAGAAIQQPGNTNIGILEKDIYETADFTVLPGVL